MLAYSKTPWCSAISPPMPPRPIVDPLVGGYRRIPVAQLGADLFCDTRIISSEIAEIATKPQLEFANCSCTEQDFIGKIGAEYFMAIVQTAKPSSVLRMLVTRYWPWQILSLMRDRAGVAKTSALPRVKREEQINRADEFKRQLAKLLENSTYLFGEQPSLGDFAAYHLIWFADLTRPGSFANDEPKVTAWQNRLANLGHGEQTKISKKQAFAAAENNTPRAVTIENTSSLAGKTVAIGPTDYAMDTISGVLIAADKDRFILARETTKFGQIHVHLPNDGYVASAL